MPDTVTKINNHDLSYYNADLLECTVGPNSITNGVLTTPFSYIPRPLKGKIGVRKIKLKMDFSDGIGEENRAVCKISQLLTDLVSLNDAGQYTELYLRDGYYYTTCFDSVSDPSTKAPWIQQCDFSFVGFRHLEPIKHNWSSSLSGSLILAKRIDRPSPIKIRIKPSSNSASFSLQLQGQTINFNSISDYVEINSLHSTVMDADGNAFDKCDLCEFPFFEGAEPFTWTSNKALDISIDIIPVTL